MDTRSSPSPTHNTVADSVLDAVCVGETMAAFVATSADTYRTVLAGAESNVAIGMALLGCSTRWLSRLGADPLGDFIEEGVRAAGVSTAVVRDATSPTGALTKHISANGTRVQYYRSQSAARSLSPEDLARAGHARLMHTTGITAAISPSARDLVEAIVDRSSGHTGLVSFDVNLRPVLWPDLATARDILSAIARKADIVFIGDDEAEALFGSSDVGHLADHIVARDDQELVLKRGSGAASVMAAGSEVAVAALPTEVVDLVGAGDAFAAGYLTARLRGWEADARLRLGHLLASHVIGVTDDVPPAFPAGSSELNPDHLAGLWATN